MQCYISWWNGFELHSTLSLEKSPGYSMLTLYIWHQRSISLWDVNTMLHLCNERLWVLFHARRRNITRPLNSFDIALITYITVETYPSHSVQCLSRKSVMSWYINIFATIRPCPQGVEGCLYSQVTGPQIPVLLLHSTVAQETFSCLFR